MNLAKQNRLFPIFVTLICFQINAYAADTATTDTPKTETPAAATAPAAVAAVVAPTPPPEAIAPREVAPKKVEEPKDLYGKQSRPLGDFEVGPYITAVTLPRPFTGGIEAKWLDLVGVSASYGFLPQLTISSVKLKMNGYDFRLKLYPFRGAFFLGVGIGSQTLTASATDSVSGIPITASGSQVNSFVAPQLGWNWVWGSGFFMGIDLGVQLSMSHTTTVTTDQDSNALVTGSTQYAGIKSNILKMADLFGKTPLPVLTLVKVGFFF